VPTLRGLKASVVSDLRAWEDFSNADAPQTAQLPGGWGDKLTPFQRLLLLKALRPEKVRVSLGLYKIVFYFGGFCARINHPCVAPSHLHCPHYCNTIACLFRSIRRPPNPPFVCHTPYSIGNGNIV